MLTKNDLVSVIIPAYNHSQYIQEAIQSVIGQTYKNIELIVIDDGSKDDTWTKINEMKNVCEERFVRVVFETQQNKGTCLTLNKLLQLAEGEYIQLLASDDKFSPESTQILHKFLSQHSDYALAVGKNEFIDEKGIICYWDHNRNNVYDKETAKYKSFTDIQNQFVNLESEDFGSYEMLLKANHIPNGYLIRKSIFDKIGYFRPEAPLEDYWLMLQIAKYAKMKYIDATTFYYRWHGANTANQIEKMLKLTNVTLSYEIESVRSSDNKQIKNILEKYLLSMQKRKILFKIPFIMQLYKRKLETKKELVLKLFNYEFTLYSKLKD